MHRTILLVWLCLAPLAAAAQALATLVADTVTVAGGDRLTATGNVEVFFEGTRLRASAISYSQNADQLTITGPIVITTPEGAILTADRAALDRRLENGMLRGARLVLDRQLQLAATQIDRAGGDVSQLYKATVTSCAVCAGRAPLWEIRAERVVHDTHARQLYFTNAQFRLRGVPIFWLPRLRLPDPSLNRATGLLIPRVRTSDRLGVGLKLPYFVTLGPSRDLLLTPYLSRNTSTLETRYRQALRNGDIAISAAVSDDNLRVDGTRGYIFATANLAFPGNYRLDLDIEAVTDDAYLLDYGYSDKDRLDSAIALTRVRDDDFLRTSLTYYESLREDEVNATLPPLVADLRYRRLAPLAGGTLTYDLGADTIVRYGDGTGDAGRDVTRLGGRVAWDRTWITPQGLAITATTGLRHDAYRIVDAELWPTSVNRTLPEAALTLRYPLVGATVRASHLIEPVIALAWSAQRGDTPPNEDSTRPELDEANLFALSRFPGEDAVETGLRGAAGLRWTRLGHGGAQGSLTFGRILRQSAIAAFSDGSGLSGRASDWLLAGQLTLPQGVAIDARGLLTDNLDVTLASARLDWRQDDLQLTAAYIWQNPAPALGRDGIVSEWSFDGAVQVTPAWNVRFETRYDIATDRPARAGLGVEWRNECVTVDLSVSRRYTSSDTLAPSTDYGLAVSLDGFSADSGGPAPSARCRN